MTAEAGKSRSSSRRVEMALIYRIVFTAAFAAPVTLRITLWERVSVSHRPEDTANILSHDFVHYPWPLFHRPALLRRMRDAYAPDHSRNRRPR